ncbi:NAD(P)-binding domain-containing protein [Gordonia terrae]|uniref:NAD(P)-binding domain-containing protein n=1 Tax=Gordonia hongkongensis TaxID=1701090 RepID=UPI0022B3DA74|nr:NAD(P)-binding domain-containing protein [Gordonia terrae]
MTTASPSLPAIAFLGLGNMGTPMSANLVDAGYPVIGFDIDAAARNALVAHGGRAAETAAEAAADASVIILMLPNSAIVEAVLDDLIAASALVEGDIVVDMSSSDPSSTRALATRLAVEGVALVDAPVSGGVTGAENGRLTIMVGGSAHSFDAVKPILVSLGTPRLGGDVGAGHAIKAINNLLSATHLLATAEAVAAAERFGLDPQVVVEMVNTSSGRSGSTDNKFPNFILPGTYDSGFALALMLKDMKIATGLAEELGVPAHLGEYAVDLWEKASGDLDAGADHTEIARWVHRSAQPSAPAAADRVAAASALEQSIVDIHGTWDESWQSIADLRPALLSAYADLASVPWRKNHLDAKTKELIYLAVDAAATHLHSPGVRQHVRAALDRGATPDEIMETIELTTTLGIHAMNIGVPLLVEVLEEEGLRDEPAELTDYQRKLQQQFTAERGYWHPFWDEMLELDPEMFEAYTEFSALPWRTGSLSPKVKELIYIAFDSAATHLYVPGWKLHIRNAIGHGATKEEILEVMEISSAMGFQAATTAFPILAEELERRSDARNHSTTPPKGQQS